jgi:hypothetical protein
MKIIWVGFIFTFLTLPAQGSLFLSPVGHREAFLGNAGVALASSPGSVLYNPAGIAFTDAPAISLSGSAVTYQEFSEHDFARTTGVLKSQSLLTSAIFSGNEDIRVAIFYAFPGNIEDYGRTVTTDATAQTIKNYEMERQLALGGIAYAGLINSQLAWGAGFNIAFRELNGLLIQEVITSGTGELFTEKTREQLVSFVLTPGFIWKVNPSYDVGVNFQWKVADLYATGDFFRSTMATGDPRPMEVSQGYTPYSDDLLGVTVGQVFFWGTQRWLLDISYAPSSGVRLEQKDDVAELKNISVGWEMPIKSNVDILAGVSYSDLSDLHFVFLTGGLAFQQRSFDGNIGIFLKAVQSEISGQADSTTIGFLYSSSIEY